MDSNVEYQESTTTTLEWTLRGLKTLFDTSKGETKSKVTKSIRFGGGRWQILFYPNSGTEGGAFVSLYLSCEPTADEKDNALNGKWVREGLFKFSFELRNVGKGTLFNNKEACDHSFSYKTANWGWAQFARRDAVYYQPNTVKHQDAFLIICTITSSPSVPVPPSPTPRQFVPRDLLDAVGSLLDDPAYSDVEFVLPRRGNKGSRRIWACRRLLRRAEYFEAMFNSGFAEASADREKLTISVVGNDTAPLSPGSYDDTDSLLNMPRPFEDSDEEDEEDMLDTDFTEFNQIAEPSSSSVDEMANADRAVEQDDEDESVPTRNVRAKHSHPSSPRAEREREKEKQKERELQVVIPGPTKVRVVVKDVAYATYRAVLHYLYTDTIVFAPLSSSFLATASSISAVAGPNHAIASSSQPPPSDTPAPPTPAASAPGQQSMQYFRPKSAQAGDVSITTGAGPSAPGGPKTRKEWIREWESANPGRVGPCSAKAVYRLADKLDLGELKHRAFQHIIKSLTVSNVPYETFSSFSAAFEDVRKVEVDYFLANWGEIRGSDAMRNVWQQIRLGRHPGFEEVWPLIAVNLEFKARSGDGAGGDGKEGSSGTGEL